MEQQQFKVSFSVGTKILVSVLALLAIVVAFLNISAILLLKEDKRAYTYQSQSTTAALAGKEFVSMARHELDTLRLALASLDPLKPVTPIQVSALQSVIDNQSEVLGASISLVDVNNGASQPIAKAVRAKELADSRLAEADLAAAPEWMKAALPELLRSSFAFLNMSKSDGTPVIGILAADLKLQGNPGGMPVALGLASLKEFGDELGGLELTVVSRTGWILFDTDPTALFSKKNIAKDPLFLASAGSKLSSGALEYDADSGHYLGSYTRPGLDVSILTRVAWQKAMKATYALTEKFILLGLMAIGIAVIFSIFFAKTLTAPIQQLYEATKEVASGNFNLDLKPASRDELGALTGSFNVMSHQISDLINQQAEKIYLENELAIASTVQQTLIPPAVFQNRNVYIHSHYQSASECGGDWWGYFGVGRKLCLMISDATGHGIPSALITASARSCFSVMQKLAQEDPDFSFSPSAMLNYANRVVFDASMGKIMMTFFIGVIDFEDGTLTYSSAGHNPPWLFKNEGDRFALKSLTAMGLRLGETRDAPPFEEKETQVSVGDVLFLYTDGLLEGKDREGEMFGKKRVRRIVEANLAKGPEEAVNELMGEFFRYNDGKLFDDDVTIAMAKVLHIGGTQTGLTRGPEQEQQPEAASTAEPGTMPEPGAMPELGAMPEPASTPEPAEEPASAEREASGAQGPESGPPTFAPPPRPSFAASDSDEPSEPLEPSLAGIAPEPEPASTTLPPPPPAVSASPPEPESSPAPAAAEEEPSISVEIVEGGEDGSGSDA